MKEPPNEDLKEWLGEVTRRRFLLGVGLTVGALIVSPGNSVAMASTNALRSPRRRVLPGWPRTPVTFLQIGDFGAGNIHKGSEGPRPTINPNAQNVAEIVATYAPRRGKTYVVSAGDNVYVPYYGDPPQPPEDAVGTNQPPPGNAPQFFQALNITPYDQAVGALYSNYIQFPPGSTSVFAPHGSRTQRFLTVIGDHDWWHQPRVEVSDFPVYPMDSAAYPAAVAPQPFFFPGAAGGKGSMYLQYFGNQGAGSSSQNTRYWDTYRDGIHWIALSSDPNETLLGTLSNAYYSESPFPPENLTPGEDNLKNSVQGKWFRSVAEKPADGWRFVFTHYPPYTSSAPELSGHNPAVFMRWGYEHFGVDMVFSGHVHSYERLYVDGVTYIVNGAGGTFEALAGFATPTGGPSQVQVADKYGVLAAEKFPGKIFFSYLATPPASGQESSADPVSPDLDDRFVLLKGGVLQENQFPELRSIHVTPGGGILRIHRGVEYSGNLLGKGLLRKTGRGRLVLKTASPNFSGVFEIVTGTTALTADDALAGASGVVLRGGRMELASSPQRFSAPLQLLRTSVLLAGDGAVISFADSSSTPWADAALLIVQGTPGPESIRFGTSASGLSSAQLQRIRLGSSRGPRASLNGNGHLVFDSGSISDS